MFQKKKEVKLLCLCPFSDPLCYAHYSHKHLHLWFMVKNKHNVYCLLSSGKKVDHKQLCYVFAIN